MVEVLGKPDSDVKAVQSALDRFCKDHTGSHATTYRYNSASIRIRILSEQFAKMDKVERHDLVWPCLELLDEDVVEQISVVLLLTPNEHQSGRSLMDIEFEDRSRSLL